MRERKTVGKRTKNNRNARKVVCSPVSTASGSLRHFPFPGAFLARLWEAHFELHGYRFLFCCVTSSLAAPEKKSAAAAELEPEVMFMQYAHEVPASLVVGLRSLAQE